MPVTPPGSSPPRPKTGSAADTSAPPADQPAPTAPTPPPPPAAAPAPTWAPKSAAVSSLANKAHLGKSAFESAVRDDKQKLQNSLQRAQNEVRGDRDELVRTAGDDLDDWLAKVPLDVAKIEDKAKARVARTHEDLATAVDEIKREVAGFDRVYARHADLPQFTKRTFKVPPPPDPNDPAQVAQAAATAAAPLDPHFATAGLSPGISVKYYGSPVDPTAAAGQQTAVQKATYWLALETRRPDIAKRLGDGRLTVVVIPHDVRMTDLPEFANMKGQKTFDGRSWDDVRGAGGQTIKDPVDGKPRIVVAIAEETLANLPGDEYGPDYSVGAHEIAHVVEDYGLPQDELNGLIAEHNAFVKNLPNNAAVKAKDPSYYGNPQWYGNQTWMEKFAMTFNVITNTDQSEGPQLGTPVAGSQFVGDATHGVDPQLWQRMKAVYPGLADLPGMQSLANGQDPWTVPSGSGGSPPTN